MLAFLIIITIDMHFFNHRGLCEYVINRDWLSFSVRALDLIDDVKFYVPPFVRVEECAKTNRYGKRAIFWDKWGDKIFTLLWVPLSKGFLDPQLVFVEIGNRYLYGRLDTAISLLQSVFRWEFNNVSRFDVCLDFALVPKYAKVVAGLYRHRYYLQRYDNGAQFIKDNYANQMSWGLPQSMLKWKLYNKTLELGVGGNHADKPYIVDEWIQGGMDIFKVWRLEASLTSLSTVVFDKTKLDLSRVLSDEFMVHMFSSLYDDRFVIKRNANKTRKSNNPTIPFLPMPDHDDITVAVPSSHSERRQIAGLAELNTLLRTLDESKFVGANVGLVKKYVALARSIVTPELLRHYNYTHDVPLFDRLEQYLYDAESRRLAF